MEILNSCQEEHSSGNNSENLPVTALAQTADCQASSEGVLAEYAGLFGK